MDGLDDVILVSRANLSICGDLGKINLYGPSAQCPYSPPVYALPLVLPTFVPTFSDTYIKNNTKY